MAWTSGALNDRIKFQSRSSNANDPDPDYSDVEDATNWPAEIIEVRGGERVRGRVIEGNVDAVIRFPYGVALASLNATLGSTWRIVATTPPFLNVVFDVKNTKLRRDNGTPWEFEADCVRLK